LAGRKKRKRARKERAIQTSEERSRRRTQIERT
jgi:hypothetical protein